MLTTIIKKLLAEIRKRRSMVEYCRSIGVRVGNGCVIKRDVYFGTEPYLIHLGNRVHLTGNVRFITHDGGVWVFREEHPDWDIVAPITVEDNVYIGVRAIVMPGVTIGRNSVIGAGSIVTRDIPPNSVAVGIPARVIKGTDEYKKTASEKIILTKLMGPKEKKDYLLRHFVGDV